MVNFDFIVFLVHLVIEQMCHVLCRHKTYMSLQHLLDFFTSCPKFLMSSFTLCYICIMLQSYRQVGLTQ